MLNRRSVLWTTSVLLLGGLSLGGCATKKYVREQVAPVAGQVQTHGARLGALDKSAREALARAEAAHKLAEGKFVYGMVLSDDGVRFSTGGAELSAEAQSRLEQLAEKLRSENRNVYIEVQGHTDSTGSKAANYRLGEARAEAVRRFLNQHGVPLSRVEAISYGPDAPVAPNDTAAGRAANRRVVVIVLA